jgi:hypothetical protein
VIKQQICSPNPQQELRVILQKRSGDMLPLLQDGQTRGIPALLDCIVQGDRPEGFAHHDGIRKRRSNLRSAGSDEHDWKVFV